MVLGKVEGDSINVQVAYSVAVNKDLLTWRVSYQGQEIQSSVLSDNFIIVRCKAVTGNYRW